MRKRLLSIVIVLVAVILGAAACSGSDDSTSGPIVDDSPSMDSAPPVPAGLNSAPRPAPTPVGESVGSFDRATAGDIAIIGVAPNETLAIYALPGEQNPVNGVVAGDADDVAGLGEAFITDDGQLWWLIKSAGIQGWIKPGAAFLGVQSEVTAEYGSLVGTSVDDLAQAVAEDLAATAAPTGQILIVKSAELTNGFEGTATIDLVGIGDDSLAGYRLLVSASGNASQGAEYTLSNVTRIALCSRGVTDSGRCE